MKQVFNQFIDLLLPQLLLLFVMANPLRAEVVRLYKNVSYFDFYQSLV